MVAYLSEIWMVRARELGGEAPETPGATARLQYVVTGGPDAEVRYSMALVDGRVVEQSLGDDPEAEVTLTLPYDVSVAILTGELDLNVAFMQGRVKIAGDMARVLGLLPATSRPEFAELQARLAAETTL